MIVPAKVDLEAWKNAVLRSRLTIQLNGEAMDLSGCSARMQVRESVMATDIKASASTTEPNADGSRITIVSPKAGVLEIFISHADLQDISTPSLEAGDASASLVWDLIIQKPNGDYFVYCRGSFKVWQGVTRD
jgi:hypothetical protein